MDTRLRIKIKFPIDAKVEDLIHKIKPYTGNGILVSRLAQQNRQLKFISMWLTEDLFLTKNY